MNKKHLIIYLCLTVILYVSALVFVAIIASITSDKHHIGIAGVMFGWFAHVGVASYQITKRVK